MKHTYKILSAILALTLVLTSNIIPTMAYASGGSATQGTTTDLEPGLIGDPDGNGPNPDYYELDENGEWVLKENIEEDIAPVEEPEPQSLLAVDITVTEIAPCKYDGVKSFSEGLAAVELDGKWGFIDKAGKEVVPCKYDRVSNFDQGLAAVRLNGKWGFIDKTGKEVVPCKYDNSSLDAPFFSEGLAGVKLDDKWGFIDKTGKEVVPCKYDGARYFSEGLAAVKLDGKWSYIDKTGKEVIVPLGKYDFVYNFSEGVARVEMDTGRRLRSGAPICKCGYIDKTGKEIVPCKYDLAYDFSEGFAEVCIGDYPNYWRGLIDKTGREVVPCKYEQVDNDFSEGLMRVRDKNLKWGFIDKTGKEVIPCKYDDAISFFEGLAAVCVGELPDKKWGFIDKTGKEVVPCTLEYYYVGHLGIRSDGLAPVMDENGKLGFIDKTGKEVMPCKYDKVESFSDGLAKVELDTGEKNVIDETIYKWGFIDTTGKEVVPCKYSWVQDFSEGLAAVELDTGEIDKNGGQVCKWGEEPKYYKTIHKWGFIDKTGKEVVLCKYDKVESFSEGLAAVELDGKWGFISVNGAAASVQTAKENVQTVKVDGKDVSFAMYSPNGGGTNYVRLVDLAVALNGTAGQYNVGYDGRVLLTSHTPYEGGTSTAPFHGPMVYTTLDEPTYVDGTAQKLEGIRFEYQGGGYTYYKLRDLGQALGFNVGWDNTNQRIYIESNKPYDPNN